MFHFFIANIGLPQVAPALLSKKVIQMAEDFDLDGMQQLANALGAG